MKIFKFTRHRPSPSRNLQFPVQEMKYIAPLLKFVILEKGGKTRRFRQGLNSGNGGFPRKGHRRVEAEEGRETL